MSSEQLPRSLLTGDQEAAVIQAVKGSKIIYGKMGSGKTVVAATAAADLLAPPSPAISRLLIVTTSQIATTVWPNVWEQWSHLAHLAPSAALAAGSVSPNARLAVINDPTNKIVVTTFALMPWFKDNQLFHHFDGLIIDETTKLSAPGSVQFRAVRNAAKKMRWRLGLTGTPINESPLALYAQALLQDSGELFGTKALAFKRKWFIATDFEQRNWELNPYTAPDFYKTAAKLFHHTPDYRHELPLISHIEHPLDPPPELVATIARFKKTKEVGNLFSQSAATDTAIARQLASGFHYQPGPMEQQEIVWHSMYRLYAAKDLVKSIRTSAPGATIIIVYNYLAEKVELRELFPESTVLTSNNAPDVMKRWNNKEIPTLLLHPASASHGIELQHGGHIIIWLSNQFSNDKQEQLNARVWRRGQEHPVDIHTFRPTATDRHMKRKVEGKKIHDIMLNEAMQGEHDE